MSENFDKPSYEVPSLEPGSDLMHGSEYEYGDESSAGSDYEGAAEDKRAMVLLDLRTCRARYVASGSSRFCGKPSACSRKGHSASLDRGTAGWYRGMPPSRKGGVDEEDGDPSTLLTEEDRLAALQAQRKEDNAAILERHTPVKSLNPARDPFLPARLVEYTPSYDRASAPLVAPADGDPSLSAMAERYAEAQDAALKAVLAPESEVRVPDSGPMKLDSLEAKLREIQNALSISQAREEDSAARLVEAQTQLRQTSPIHEPTLPERKPAHTELPPPPLEPTLVPDSTAQMFQFFQDQQARQDRRHAEAVARAEATAAESLARFHALAKDNEARQDARMKALTASVLADARAHATAVLPPALPLSVDPGPERSVSVTSPYCQEVKVQDVPVGGDSNDAASLGKDELFSQKMDIPSSVMKVLAPQGLSPQVSAQLAEATLEVTKYPGKYGVDRNEDMETAYQTENLAENIVDALQGARGNDLAAFDGTLQPDRGWKTTSAWFNKIKTAEQLFSTQSQLQALTKTMLKSMEQRMRIILAPLAWDPAVLDYLIVSGRLTYITRANWTNYLKLVDHLTRVCTKFGFEQAQVILRHYLLQFNMLRLGAVSRFQLVIQSYVLLRDGAHTSFTDARLSAKMTEHSNNRIDRLALLVASRTEDAVVQACSRCGTKKHAGGFNKCPARSTKITAAQARSIGAEATEGDPNPTEFGARVRQRVQSLE